MFKNMSRAERRHHRARLKKNRRNYWGYGRQGWNIFDIKEMSAYQAGVVTRTPTPCSCYMCGNQRHNTWQNKKECLTMQERKALEDYNNQMEEL